MRQNSIRVNPIKIPLKADDYFFINNAFNCFLNKNIMFEGENIKYRNHYSIEVYRFAHKISRMVDFEMFKLRDIGFSYEYDKKNSQLIIFHQNEGIDISFTNRFIKLILEYTNSKHDIYVQFIDVNSILGGIYFINKEKVTVITNKDILVNGKGFLEKRKSFWKKYF